MNETLIELNDITKTYDDGKVKALNKVNLKINRGEFISIIGPSGSGKSTLLNMLGALDIPDSGSININGKNLRETDLSEFRCKEVGFIFQLHNLIPNLSVVENVEIPLVGTNTSEEEMKEKALKLLKSVDLESKINQKPTKLSGGQRQRVAIARALINNPSIILADEPTGALDSKTGELILDLLKNIQKENNKTLIIVTHELDVAKMADRTIKIKDGEIIADYLN